MRSGFDSLWTHQLDCSIVAIHNDLEFKMICVKTYLDKSALHGIGIFAAERIVKGTLVWVYNSNVDWLTSEEQLQLLSRPCQEQIRKYAYFDETRNALVMCGDDGRHMNHSNTPSCSDTDIIGSTTAARDIEIGEELTSDYASFTSTQYQYEEFK